MTENVLPMPTIGKLLQQFCLAFSHVGKQDEETLRKRLQRRGDGRDMAPADTSKLIKERIDYLERVDPTLAAILDSASQRMLDIYRFVVLNCDFIGLSRAQSASALAAHLFLPMAACVVRAAESQDGLDPSLWATFWQNTFPIRGLFSGKLEIGCSRKALFCLFFERTMRMNDYERRWFLKYQMLISQHDF